MEGKMSIYEYKTQIRYQDINEENELSDKGILNILLEAAGVHSKIVGYSLNNADETGYSWMLLYWKIKVYKRPCWNTRYYRKNMGKRIFKSIIMARF